jgi:NAD(P)-dependent dehydrogenase (short-subunit alcohol dehydrogenase family)
MTQQAIDGTDRYVLVAGAAGGIGSACARALARAGFGLVLVGRRKELLDAVGAQVNAEGTCAVIRAADVSDPEQVEAAVTSVPGTLWGCVHAAGTNRTGPTLSFSDQDFDLLVRMNIRSTFLLFRAAARRMLSSEGGRLVAISSQMGSVGYPGRAAYCASKHAVNGLVRALAVEWASAGVTVNAVAPTFVETEMTAPMLRQRSFLDDVLRRLPLGRVGTAEEVADVVTFLVSPQASLVTGSIVAADGGWTAW